MKPAFHLINLAGAPAGGNAPNRRHSVGTVYRHCTAPLPRAERNARTEPPHVGILRNQLLHQRVVVFNIPHTHNQHEIADAGITARWETDRRPVQLRWPVMHDGQIAKIAAACDFLERELDTRNSVAFAPKPDAAANETRNPEAAHSDWRPDIGDIALVTALSWVEFRRVYDFLTRRPRLARWYATLSTRPSMLATTLEGQTHD